MKPRHGWSCLFVCMCIAAVVASGSVRDARAQDRPAPRQNPAAGAAVFGEKGCAACHAVSGEGGALAPDLRAAAGGRTFHDLAAALWNHLPAMTERMEQLGIDRPRLSPQETGDLIAFLYSLDYFEPPGDAQRGRGLFEDKSCIRCHRVGGVGGVVGPDLDYFGSRGVPIEVATAMWNHAPAMEAAAIVRGIELPVLDGGELADLIAYLEQASLRGGDESVHVLPGRADRGRALIDDRGCTSCHGSLGTGGRLAPDLAGKGRGFSLTGFVAEMWNKGPAMRAAARRTGSDLPELTAGEVADIVAYLHSVDYFVSLGNAARGRSVIRTGGCLACHSLGEAGAPSGLDLGSVSGLDQAAVIAALWNHTLVGLRSPATGPEAWPALTGAQMADLTAYFETGLP